MDHFPQVLDAIWDVRPKYSYLGLALGVRADSIAAIEKSCSYQVDECFKKVLEECLRNGITQKKVSDALKSRTVGYGVLGETFLAMKFVNPQKEVRKPIKSYDFKFDHFEVKNHHLSMLEWRDGANSGTVRVYDSAAVYWERIAERLGLETGEIVGINRNNYDDRSRLSAVFQRWFENANGLPNARRYPKKWSGLIKLLDDSQLGELSEEVEKAMKAPYSDARRNL